MVLYSNFSEFVTNRKDHRVSGWLLMSSPVPTLLIITAYLVFVFQGQKMMKQHQPWDLRSLIVVYNFFLVILSAFMVYEFVMSSWTVPGFSLACQRIDYSYDPNSIRLAGACWWFYFSKLIELMDTVFFVLRKKNSQISFLHVYHHSTMPFLWWLGVRFVGGGEAYFSPTINSMIHVLMYLYYMLSAMGPSMQPYLFWKKYMTRLQLAQFWLVLCKTVCAIYINCGYPLEYQYFLVFYMMSHIVLFSNFYIKTYQGKGKLSVEETPSDNNNRSKPIGLSPEEINDSVRQRK
ncbi:elongation of very long chain fatty acids protein 4 [Biomphalaria pfeifferi]|uniref:Elongation of very long chain fatty acids protein n=1 Tax=Biomphalaria pfeifferi TaxID=112525 RepID=A0AAD8FL99_BIOPF|nr:elongation of very long chain fatty acids protein 4 [Biomphalaria pfeifferi]